jgi:hypothetical protein
MNDTVKTRLLDLAVKVRPKHEEEGARRRMNVAINARLALAVEARRKWMDATVNARRKA